MPAAVGMDPPPQRVLLQLMVFTLEGQPYGVPLAVVDRVLPMVAVSPLPQAPPIPLGVINLHGQPVPILDVRRRFGLAPRTYDLTSHLLVAQTSRQTVAVPVDEVLEVREIAADAATPALWDRPSRGQEVKRHQGNPRVDR